MQYLQFRKMSKVDLGVVTKIESDCQSHPWTLLQFLDGFNAGHECLVACKDFEGKELIVGFAVVSSVMDECTLLNLCVRPAFQKQGYGKSIIGFILEQAREKKICKIYLEVRSSNSTAIKFYEGLGFGKISKRKDYYPAVIGREDGLVYFLSFA